MDSQTYLTELIEIVNNLRSQNASNGETKALHSRFRELLPKLVSTLYPVKNLELTRIIVKLLELSVDSNPNTFESSRLIHMIGELIILLSDPRISLECEFDSQSETRLISKLVVTYLNRTNNLEHIGIFFEETLELIGDALDVYTMIPKISGADIFLTHYDQFLASSDMSQRKTIDVSNPNNCLSLIISLIRIIELFLQIETTNPFVTGNKCVWPKLLEVSQTLMYIAQRPGSPDVGVTPELKVLVKCLSSFTTLLESSVNIPTLYHADVLQMISSFIKIRTQYNLGDMIDRYLFKSIYLIPQFLDDSFKRVNAYDICKMFLSALNFSTSEEQRSMMADGLTHILKLTPPTLCNLLSTSILQLFVESKIDINVELLYKCLISQEIKQAPQEYKHKRIKLTSSAKYTRYTHSNSLNTLMSYAISISSAELPEYIPSMYKVLKICLNHRDIFLLNPKGKSYFEKIVIKLLVTNFLAHTRNAIETYDLNHIDRINDVGSIIDLIGYILFLLKSESSILKTLYIKIYSLLSFICNYVFQNYNNTNNQSYLSELISKCLCWMNWMPNPEYTNNLLNIYISILSERQVFVKSALHGIPNFLLRHGIGHIRTLLPKILSVFSLPLKEAEELVSPFISHILCLCHLKIDPVSTVLKIGYKKVQYGDLLIFLPACPLCDDQISEDTFTIEGDQVESYLSSLSKPLPDELHTPSFWSIFSTFAFDKEVSGRTKLASIKHALIPIIKHLFVIDSSDVNMLSSDMSDMVTNLLECSIYPNYNIRLNSAIVLGACIERKEVKGSSPINMAIIEGLCYRMEEVKANIADIETIETLLMNMRIVACKAQGWYSLPPLLAMIPFLVHDSIRVRAIVYDQLNEFSLYKKLSMSDIIYGFGGKIYWKLVKQLRTNLKLVEETVSALLDLDITTFLQNAKNTLLPDIVLPKIVLSVSRDLLEDISQRLSQPPKSLLLDALEPILFSIMTHGSQVEKTNPACEFLYKQLNTRLSKFIERCRSGLLKRIVMLLGNPGTKQKGEVALYAVINFSSPNTKSMYSQGNDHTVSVADFLKDHFLELADEIIHKNILKVDSSDGATKIQAVLALRELIKYMKPHLSNFYLKITTSLKLIIDQYAELREAACQCYSTLLKCLDSKDIGSILGQTVVHLYPFLDDCESQVVDILTHLIIDRSSQLSAYFKDIPFIPDKPSLTEIRSTWEKYVFQGNDIEGASLRNQLKELTRLVESESENMRLMSLHQISIILEVHREEINLILLSESVDRVFNALIEALVKGCRDQNMVVRSKFGEVLGKLGAIDPGRIDVVTHPDLPNLDKKDVQLAQELVETYLVKAYRSASNVASQDNAAYSIQEILKCFSCDDKTPFLGSLSQLNDSQKKAYELWSNISSDVRTIIQPFLTSKYEIVTNITGQRESNTPIYSPNMRFGKWLAEWSQKLIFDSKSPIFGALTCVVKDELDICRFIIPHLVLRIFQDGLPTAQKNVLNEILAVINDTENTHTEINQMAVQQVFSLISTLSNYVEQKKRVLYLSKASSQDKAIKKKFANVEKMLQEISQTHLAKAAFGSKAYARALLHLENSLIDNKKYNYVEGIVDIHPSDINLLQQIYSNLDEPDSIAGLATITKHTSPLSVIIENESACKWDEALMAIDHALQQKGFADHVYQELRIIRLKCLRNLGFFDQLLNFVKVFSKESDMMQEAKYSNQLVSYGTQAALRLGSWELAEEFLKSSKAYSREAERTFDTDFDLAVVNLLVSLKNNDRQSFRTQIHVTRNEIMTPLAAASLDSYPRAYPFISQLHILSEINDSWKIVHKTSRNDMTTVVDGKDESVDSIIKNWDAHLKLTQPSFTIRESILQIRAAAFELTGMTEKVGKTWMQIAKHARTSGRFRMAHYALFKAKEFRGPQYFIEKSKLLWSTRQEQDALLELQNIIKNKSMDSPTKLPRNRRDLSLLSMIPKSNVHVTQDELIYNKALLLSTKWMHETAQISHDEIVQQYDIITHRVPQWEKGFFHFGRYYDSLVQEFKKELYKNRDNPIDKRQGSVRTHWEYIPHVIYNYAASMFRGHSYAHQTIPRILTLWFDSGESIWEIIEQNRKSSKPSTKIVAGTMTVTQTQSSVDSMLASKWPQIQEIIRFVIDNLPTQLWLSTFPRLVARVNHQNPDVWRSLKTLIVKILLAYPHQAIWYLLPLSQSNNFKMEKYMEIKTKALEEAGTFREELAVIMDESEYLANEILTICNFRIPREYNHAKSIPSLNIAKICKLKTNIPVHVIIPIERQLNDQTILGSTTGIPHDRMVYIRDFNTKVQVMKSLQKPKKIKILGSDGISYDFLCKPKDDLRKDSRMMEFSTMINRLLKKDPEGRKRQLNIRTYPVIPLNESSGIIGWVPNTTGFRNILVGQYTLDGINYHDTFKTVKEIFDGQKGSKLLPRVFKERVLPLFPPVFRKWFISNFSEPSRWYRARISFARTTAVMSMVGAIVGLGDRHGENILIDSKTGDCVHVDLNCLFLKGLTFNEPERVPFRLTQNMVDALGVTGYEGIFKRVCEITMHTLRKNKETLMSVMETLVHDPLLEWVKSTDNSRKSTGRVIDKFNIEALETLRGISDRIDGIKRTPSNKDDVLLPLSVEGLVTSLINDATSLENLANMYIGWTAFL